MPDGLSGASLLRTRADGETQDLLRAQKAFLAHLRHELRTPINAIIGYSELLLEDTEQGGALATDLHKINAAGKQLLALVNDVLDTSRIEARPELDIADFEARTRHALRTPISSVIGYTDLLLEDAEAAGQLDILSDLQRIRAAAERLLALIADILSLWQVQAGRLELHLGESDGSFQMVRAAVETIHPLGPRAPAQATAGGSLLVVDDNETNRDLLSRHLRREGHQVSVAEDGQRALALLQAGAIELVLLDILMPGMSGYQVLEHLKANEALRHIPVIMLSALDDMDSVVRCIELGADDYLPKPFNPVLLRARIDACLQKKRLRDRELAYLEQVRVEREESLRELLSQQDREPAVIVGSTGQTVRLRREVKKAATNDEPFLVLGEPGTEKNMVAQVVHEQSPRDAGPFLRLDCAQVAAPAEDGGRPEAGALAHELAQMSALFGHQSGAFSFARTNRAGYLELAAGGTLLLENVERLAPAAQEHLLAFLRTGRLRRLGGDQDLPSDVRVAATSSVTLAEEVTRARFSPELHALLAAQSIVVPPLRERRRDLMPLVNHLIARYSRRLDKEVTGIMKRAMNLILAYDWPNNMDELQGVVQRGVRLADGPLLTSEQIFIGLAPFEPTRRLDLLRFPLLRNALQSRWYPGILQILSAAAFGLVVLSGLLGPQQTASNVTAVLAWALAWPLLIVAIFFVGRLPCALCPLGAIAAFGQRWWSLRKKVPRPVREYGVLAAGAGFLLIIWLEQVTRMAESPRATALLLLAILAGAVVSSLLFERAAWCRYLCPLGRMIGTFATLSMVELRTNPAVCSAECKTHGCYTGAEAAPGCPMYEGAFAIQSSEACKLCANCLKNCPNRAIRLNLRPPGSEVLALRQHSPALGYFVPVLMATTLGIYLRATDAYRTWLGDLAWEPLVYLVGLVGLAAALAAAMALAAALARERPTRGLSWLPYAFLPLALAGEMSHQLIPLLAQGGQLLPALASQFALDAWQPEPLSALSAAPAIQTSLLLLGFAGSVYLVHRLLARYRPSAKALARAPAFALVAALSLSYALLLRV